MIPLVWKQYIVVIVHWGEREFVEEDEKINLTPLPAISLSILVLKNVINTTFSMIVSIVNHNISILNIVKTWLLPNKADSGSSSLSELQTHLHHDNDADGGDDDDADGDDDDHLVWYGKLSRMAMHFCRSITSETAFADI